VSLEFSDLFLADGALIAFGNDQDVTITHLADAGLLLNGARGLFFNDTTQYINAPNGTTLDIAATDEIELNANATLIDINGAVDISGNLDVGGNLVVTGTTTFNGGTLTMGDAATDNVVFGADINSNIIPNTDDTYDLGSSSQEWRNLYIDGTANIDSLVADTADINGGTIDGATIATSDITVGSGKTLNVSAGTLTLADNQISGDKVEGGTIAATTITTLTSTTGNITSVNATTVDTTNLEVTTLKAKDGTAAGSIADSTGVVTLASSVLTTTDINGGTVDGVTIGGSSAGDITYANLSDGTITITAFVDEDDMSSDSATLVPTQQSVKAYVDSQVGTVDTLSEILANGNTTGSTDIAVDSAQKVQFRDAAIYLNSSVDGQLDIVADTEIQIAATTVDLNGNLDVSGTALVAGVLTTTAATVFNGGFASNADSTLGTDKKVQFRDSAIYINSSVDGQLDIVADTEIQIAATTVDLNGNLDVSGTALVAGVLTTTAATVFNGGFASNADSTLGTDKKVQFRDAAIYINSSVDGQLDIVADTEIQIAATTIDIDGAINASGEIIAASLDISGDIDVDGTSNLDILDVDGAANFAADVTLADGADLITASAGTSNFRAGVNAGNSIESGGDYNTVVGDEAGTAITTGDGNVFTGYASGDALTLGSSNTAVGRDSLGADTKGNHSVAIGRNALTTQNFTSATDAYNTAVGSSAGAAVTTGTLNTLIGGLAGDALTTGDSNTAIGYVSLSSDTKGERAVAVGEGALFTQNFTSETNNYNTAVGYNAGYAITTGIRNVLIGGLAGDALQDADFNVGVGYGALSADTLGSGSVAIGDFTLVNQNFTSATTTYNTAVGYAAGAGVTTGVQNTLIGGLAGDAITTASYNTAVGYGSLTANTTGADNTAVGRTALENNTTASNNTAVGKAALAQNTTGANNTALGYLALNLNTTAANNTAVGKDALGANTEGTQNTALGTLALAQNTTANDNIAIGFQALTTNTTGASNTAVGKNSLANNTTAANNTAVGFNSLGENTTGEGNLAVGANALDANTTGANLVAIGSAALGANTTASNNTAVGAAALVANTTGAENTAVGLLALSSNTTASNNTAVGRSALIANTEGAGNTAVGSGALLANTTGTGNTAVGEGGGSLMTTGSKNTILGRYNGNQGGLDIRTASNHIVLSDGDGNPRVIVDSAGNFLVGKTSTGTGQGFEAQADGEVYTTIVDGLNTYHVYANSGYRFYVKPDGGIVNYSSNNVNLSDEREKKNIEPLESQWDSLKQWSLKKFHYNADDDSDNKKLGVIAQEVETHNPEVIAEFNVDDETTRMAIKEQQMMWMAIKALQEAQTRIETLEAKVAALES
jgi:hypothetical protein